MNISFSSWNPLLIEPLHFPGGPITGWLVLQHDFKMYARLSVPCILTGGYSSNWDFCKSIWYIKSDYQRYPQWRQPGSLRTWDFRMFASPYPKGGTAKCTYFTKIDARGFTTFRCLEPPQLKDFFRGVYEVRKNSSEKSNQRGTKRNWIEIWIHWRVFLKAGFCRNKKYPLNVLACSSNREWNCRSEKNGKFCWVFTPFCPSFPRTSN